MKHLISGVHTLIYSHDADADRAFFSDVLGLDSVDSGGGWLIFAFLPLNLRFTRLRTRTITSSTCCAKTSRPRRRSWNAEKSPSPGHSTRSVGDA